MPLSSLSRLPSLKMNIPKENPKGQLPQLLPYFMPIFSAKPLFSKYKLNMSKILRTFINVILLHLSLQLKLIIQSVH